MFDIGLSEIVVIGVVALVVIGPERLPKTARMLGHLFGRLQRYVNEVKSDISREMELDELRRLKRDVESAARDIQQSVNTATAEVNAGVRSVEQQVTGAGEPAAASASNPLPEPAPDSTQATPHTPSTPALRNAAAPVEAPRQPSLPGFDQQ
ncbi:MAG: Sec-independent protein translocase protein TatB [Betaproteobacteria bacterium]